MENRIIHLLNILGRGYLHDLRRPKSREARRRVRARKESAKLLASLPDTLKSAVKLMRHWPSWPYELQRKHARLEALRSQRQAEPRVRAYVKGTPSWVVALGKRLSSGLHGTAGEAGREFRSLRAPFFCAYVSPRASASALR